MSWTPMSGASNAATLRRRRRAAARGRRLLGVAALATAAALAVSGCAPIAALVQQATAREPELPPRPDGTVEGFGAQQPDWAPCGDGLECAVVHAPLDWEQTSGETITLSLVKQEARGGEPIGTLFVNPGGPGASGIDYLSGGVGGAVQPDVQEAYDVVAWDPRGVGASTPVTCLDDAAMDDYLFGVDPAEQGLEKGSDAWMDAALAHERDFGEACLEQTGDLLAHVSTAETVRDLDMLRAIVGDPQLNYLGYSYGTYIGARYADAYPDRVGRLVLDGAMDPSASLADVVREQTRGFETALRAYTTDCLTRDDCPLDGPVDVAMAQISALLDRVEAEPLTGSDGRAFTVSTMLTAIITPLYSQGNWGYLDELFSTVAAGDADTGLMLADFYYDRQNGAYLSNSTEAFTAINCLDYPAGSSDRDQMRADAAELDEIAPTIGRFQGYGDLACAAWPEQPTSERGPVAGAGAAPILVVGTTGDPATPYRWAESLADQLESGVLVTYQGEGHTAYGENDCVDDTIDAYLLTGATPAADPQCS
ncbi:alpha/beta hydrolase [Leucobacter chromiiresistens]|uniref:alpha/beta hydrolase n=1 Tax=Leucobacter chromiiresistens TaxID=1079994 RepID=UPI000AB06877|nr:alpha/beta hydrolase [Leucobacter chromiiresistens]